MDASEVDETIHDKRKLPKKKTQRNDRVLEQKLLQARKNEKILVPRSKIILPKIPVAPELRSVSTPPLFFPSLQVSMKSKQAPKVKEKPKYLLKQVERIQLPETPKQTNFLRKQKPMNDQRSSAFFQPAIDRNSHNQNLYFLSHSELKRNAKQRKKKIDSYSTIRTRAFDEIRTIDNDIQQFIDGVRKDIKKSSNDIMREMEQQRHATRKQIAELRKMFTHNNKTTLDRFS